MLIADLPSLCSVSIGDESFWSCEMVAMISTLLYGRHRASGKNSDSENVLVMRGWVERMELSKIFPS